MTEVIDVALPLGVANVRVVVGEHALQDFGDLALERASKGVLIVDRALPEDVSAACDHFLSLQVSEVAPALRLRGEDLDKNVDALPALWRELNSRDLDRASFVVIAGGGGVLDLGAFLAATYLRGLRFVLVPTTLLAQVDASLGGKCGVNLDAAKNQVGLIVQPEAIVADLGLLSGLSDIEWRSGLGEVLKTALLQGPELLGEVRSAVTEARPRTAFTAIVAACLREKARRVAADLQDRGGRLALNLGHSVGHVLEALYAEAGTYLPHGLAVAAGLEAEARAFSSVEVADLVALARRELQLELPEPPRAREERIAALLRRDKKRIGQLVRVPCLLRPGSVALRDVPLSDLEQAIAFALHPDQRAK